MVYRQLFSEGLGCGIGCFFESLIQRRSAGKTDISGDGFNGVVALHIVQESFDFFHPVLIDKVIEFQPIILVDDL